MSRECCHTITIAANGIEHARTRREARRPVVDGGGGRTPERDCRMR